MQLGNTQLAFRRVSVEELSEVDDLEVQFSPKDPRIFLFQG
jgi:hypothetical protein